jgi:hypothetical protein
MDPATRTEVETLCAALCEDAITDDQMRRLETLVLSDLTARRMYIEKMNLHAGLRWYSDLHLPECLKICSPPDDTLCGCIQESAPAQGNAQQAAENDADGQAASVSFRARVIRPAWHFVRQPAAASFLLAGFFMFTFLIAMGIIPLPGKDEAPTSNAIRPGDATVEVATVTGTQRCRWDAAGSVLRYGSRLHERQHVVLTRGVVEITCDDGVQLLLEGPVTYIVEQSGRGFLERGSLTARVPHEAIGFTVATPSAVLIDQGTEFGVRVDAPDMAEVHVFVGRVEGQLVGQDGPTAQRIELARGLGARFDSVLEQIIPLTSTGERFVRGIERDDPAAVSERARKAVALWQAHSQKLRRDPKLIAYYTFERQGRKSATLANRAAATFGHLQGVLGDGRFDATRPSWAVGRWLKKGALEFIAGRDQRVGIAYERGLLEAEGELTVAASVRPDHGGLIVQSRNVRTEGMNYQFGVFDTAAGRHAGTIFFGVGGKSADQFVYSDPVVPAGREWHQVAVTCRDRSVTFYFDGAPAGERTLGRPLVAKDADLMIGRGVDSDSKKGKAAQTGFDGRLDELLIFRRVLVPDEIRLIAQAGKEAEADVNSTEKTVGAGR